MSRFLRVFAFVVGVFFAGNVLAGGYTCPTYKVYTGCNKGYYLTGSPTSNVYDATPGKVGNACRPSSAMGQYNGIDIYTCAGGTAAPVKKTVRVTYNWNGASYRPSDQFVPQPVAQYDFGETVSLLTDTSNEYYRAGYQFRGWSTSQTATSGTFTMTFTDNTMLYAVWVPCAQGRYKPASAAAAASCSAMTDGYYGTGCASGGYTACTGQAQCTGTTYCQDHIKQECPNPNLAANRRETLPAAYKGAKFASASVVSANGRKAPGECKALIWYDPDPNATGQRVGLFEYVSLSDATMRYEGDVENWMYDAVGPGYYLTNKSACGAYAYYKQVVACPDGSYCPGKAKVECNASNQSTVHTTDFGRESCPGEYTHSDGARSSVNNCYLTTAAGKYVKTAKGNQVACNVTEATDSYYPGGIKVYYGSTGGWTYMDTGYQNAALSGGSCANIEPCPAGTWADVAGWCPPVDAGSYPTECAGKDSDGYDIGCFSMEYCSSLPGSPKTGTFNSPQGAKSNRECTYTPAGKSIAGCKTVTPITVTYTGQSWPANIGAYAVTPNTGYVATNNNTAAATCNPGTYTITLNATQNGGTGGWANVYEVYNVGWYSDANDPSSLVEIGVPIPTKANSVFNGYYTAATGGTQRITETGGLPATTTFTANTTLYAQFSACAACTKGKGVKSCSASVTDNTCEYSATCDSGYKNPTCDSAGKCSCTGNTFYIKYNAGGGSGSAPTAPTSCVVGSGNCYAPENTYILTGHTFVAWRVGGQQMVRVGTELSNLFTTMADGETLTLMASWVPNLYEITLDPENGDGGVTGGGSGGTSVIYEKYGQGWYSDSAGTSAITTITLPTKTNSVFKRYIDKKDEDTIIDATGKIVASNKRYTSPDNTAWAEFEQVTCNITNGTAAASVVANRASCNIICTQGYSKLGGSDTTQEFTLTAANSGDATITASCHPRTYKIIYNVNATSGVTSNGTTEAWYKYQSHSPCYYYSNAATTTCLGASSYTITTPARTGYTFDGYYTNADGTGTQYTNANGNMTNNLYANHIGDITLYAKWTLKSVKCDAGKYLPGGALTCSTCEKGYYCPGGTYSFSADVQGRTACNAGTYNPNTGSSAASACVKASAGYYVPSAGASSQTACIGRTKYSSAGASSCSTVSTGYYTTGCNASSNSCTGQSQCTGATYCASGVQNNCPAQTSGWTRNSGTGWTAVTQCNQTKTGTAISSYCSSGVLKQNATSATAWGPTTIAEALHAKQGSIVNGQTCTQCGAGTYSIGDVLTECTACPAGDAGWTVTSPVGSTAFYECYETRTPQNCASGTVRRNAMYISNPSGSLYDPEEILVTQLKSKAGYYASATATSCTICPAGSYCPASATTATKCANWTYAPNSGMASCTACPTVTSGWSKADSTGTGWTSHTSCAQISPTPAGCASGNVKQTAASNGATTWAASVVNTALSAEPGYRVNGASCSICTGATYSAGGTATSCSTCPTIYQSDTTSGKTKDTECKVKTDAGKYIKKAKDSAQTTCPIQTYCPSASVAYGSANSPTACPSAAEHARTTYPDDYLNPELLGITLQNWTTGLKTITDCRANYQLSNEAGNLTVESVLYNATTQEYDVNGSKYYSTLNPGWYFTERYNASYCNTTSNRMLYKNVAQCPENHYCPGYTTMPLCKDGDYTAEKGKNACSSLGTGVYTKSPAKSGPDTACYLTTTSTKFVKTAKFAPETCTAGGYCPGGVKVNWNSTGGRTACNAGTYNPNTGSSAASACVKASVGYHVPSAGAASQTACTGATYTDTVGASSCTACPAVDPNKTPGGTGAYGYYNLVDNTSVHSKKDGCSAFFNGLDLNHGHVGNYRCYWDTTSGMYDYYCTVAFRELSCDGGYFSSRYSSASTPDTEVGYGEMDHSQGSREELVATCRDVEKGYYSPAGDVLRTHCPAGLTTIGYGAGADEAGDCGRVMHMGEDKLYLRSTKKTTPSLNVKVGDTTYYGNMTSGTTNGKLRVKSGTTTYSVHDDSM